MSKADAEYAAMLAGGNTTLFFHSIQPGAGVDELHKGVEEAIYRAVRQVFADRLKIQLPMQMPDLWADDAESPARDTEKP